MMKVKRYKNINVIDGSIQVDYELPTIAFGKSIVDKSGFVPIADAVKGLTAGNRAHVDMANSYDFVDGKDTGIDVSLRRPGVDIAQLFQESHAAQVEFSKSVISGSERVSRRARADKNNGVSSTGSDSVPTSE